MAKAVIELPGASVVVKRPNLGMSELVEVLGDCLKEAKKAAEQFDIKTFERMMSDKAKAPYGWDHV